MKLAAHLSRSRHGIFYFRWPLSGHSESRQTMRLSLQTRCPNRAGLLARHLASFGHDLSASLNKGQMRYQDIRQHVQKMMSQELALRLQQLNEDGPDGLPMSRGAQNTRDLIAAGTSTYWDTVGEEGQDLQLTKFAAASGIPMPEVMAERDKILPLIFQGLAALIKEFDSRKALIEGIDLSGRAPIGEHAAVDVPTPTESSKTLAEVVALFVAEQVRVGAWVVRTRVKRETTLGVLVELIGGDTAMDQITKKHAQDVKSVLLKLPPNKNKNPLTRDLSLREAANVPGLEHMSTVTLNGYLSDFHTFTEWAARNGYGKEKLFDGMTVRAGKRSAAADEAREAFSEEATALMVEELNRKDSKLVKKACYRWASLLGIFTGARLNEICGLRVADVQEIDGILCISINDEDPDNNKSLKTAAARRIVPVHSKLIEFGFVEFVEAARKRSATARLFPEFPFSEKNNYGRNQGRWFNEVFLPALGLKTPTHMFHSLRHTLITRLHQAGVALPITQTIVGHEREGVTVKTYFKEGYTVAQLREAIERFGA